MDKPFKKSTEISSEVYLRKMFAELFMDLNEIEEQIGKLQDKYLKIYFENMPPFPSQSKGINND